MASTTSLEITENEFNLAFQRSKLDRPYLCFISYPSLFKWAESDKTWRDSLIKEIRKGYKPHTSHMCFVPKPRNLVRPANILHLKDEVVYNVILGKLYDNIYKYINANNPDIDSSYPLAKPPKTNWIKPVFPGWKAFGKRSINYIESGYRYVIFSDITGFYENIHHSKLLGNLREIGETSNEINLLRACLRLWSYRGDVGIPQGYSASHILAKLFANKLDNLLKNDGYIHLRYVDDIRIFCKSKTEAKKAILDLSKHAHDLGLNLQSAKTIIYTGSEAISEINGTIKKIDGVRDDILIEIRKDATEIGPYPIAEEFIGNILERLKGDPPEVIERAFEESFNIATTEKFNKSLFHYLINRLGDIASRFAVGYCLETLRERPEETEFILKYFKKIGLVDDDINAVINILVSGENIYEYQKYQILKYFYDNLFSDQQVLTFARKITRDKSYSQWIRCFAFVYIGKFGNQADLDYFLVLYKESTSSIEKAHIVEALKRMEPGTRNHFYSQIEETDVLIKIAVNLAKSG